MSFIIHLFKTYTVRIYSILIMMLIATLSVYGQHENDKVEPSYQDEIKAHQKQLNKEFKDKEETPLTKPDRRKFKKLDFYPIDSNYCVKARFIKAENEKPFEMKTTTDRKPVYERYGTLIFTINSKPCTLQVYQSHKLREMEKYKDHLFLPFKDLSCAKESYGGGRFLDLQIPTDSTLIVDFNLAYNPYCAYNHKYSCPIVPSENSLNVEILAGVKAFSGGHDEH